MKIVAGFGSIDAYPALAEAGADELFCGYVPFEYISPVKPLNRREVRAVNVQIGSESELMILSRMMRSIGVPVTIAFNALCYTPDQLTTVTDIIEKCIERGFNKFIVADPALVLRIRERQLPAAIHISGEIGEMNHRAVRLCKEWGAKRIIFHRRMAIDAMAACVQTCPELEYEAFVLNELCHFHGGFCNTLHCDALDHMCRVPYRIDSCSVAEDHIDGNAPGASGCGLCALYRLRNAGITHLKIVGRGNYPELMLQDVRRVRQAISILEQSAGEDAYIAEMKSVLYANSCPQNCYYLF